MVKKSVTSDKPYAFTFWQSDQKTPSYITLCAATHKKNLPGSFELVQLDYESCLEWVPERDLLMELSNPATPGQSNSEDGRRWAIFCDLLRVALLNRFGGIWIDADTLVFPQFCVLADLLGDHQFIASEAEGGRIANTIMGACKNSPFIGTFWEEICRILDDKKHTGVTTAGWGEYGHWITRQILAECKGENIYIMPFGMVLPFDTGTRLTIFKDMEEFDRFIPVTALGLSFFNNTLDEDLRKTSTKSLLAANSVFSHAYRIAMAGKQKYFVLKAVTELLPLNRLRPARDLARMIEKKNRNMTILRDKLKDRNAKIGHLKELARKLAVKDDSQPDENAHREKVFGTIFKEGLWEIGGSRSGCGSSMRQTETIREALPALLSKHKIKKLLDLPCGDFNWMQHVDLTGIDYIGGDIVSEIISENARYANEHRSFEVLDIVNDQLPETDCILCRDCYSHLPNKEVIASLDKIAHGSSKYLLVTHYPESGSNEDIAVGDFRRINFEQAPFFLPPPCDVLLENHPNPKHADKSLALWRVSDLKRAIKKRR